MILLIALTSCETIEKTPIEVPPFSVAQPKRPTLEVIPQDTSGAIKALTVNLSRLVAHADNLEVYISFMKGYYETVINIVTQ